MFNVNQPDYVEIKQSTIDALKRYVEKGTPPGGFLMGVLTNNFIEACGRADADNRKALYAIHLFIYNEIPADCWGSVEKVQKWIEHDGLEGLKEVV